MRNRVSDVLLGILFFGTLTGLGIVTIGLSDFAIGRKTWRVEILSPDVGYLRAGDPVLLHGMPAGKVLSVERLADAVLAPTPAGALVPCTIKIITRMDIDPFTTLGLDHEIYIEDRGLLGGKLIRMEAGKEAPLMVRGDRVLIALATPTAWHALGSFIDENRQPLRTLLTDLGEMANHANEGGGLLGMLLRDEEVVTEFRNVADTISASATEIREGRGTLGALIYDEAMAENTRTLVADLSEGARGISDLGARISSGEGTLGRLVNDETLYNDLQEFFANATDITTDIKAGQGTMGRLFTDQQLYDDAALFMADMRSVGQDLDNGRGLLGMLVKDEALATDLRETLRQIRAMVEDFRETTPVQDLGSFIFGTF